MFFFRSVTKNGELQEGIYFQDLTYNYILSVVHELAVTVLHLLDVAESAVLRALSDGEAAVKEVVQLFAAGQVVG